MAGPSASPPASLPAPAGVDFTPPALIRWFMAVVPMNAASNAMRMGMIYMRMGVIAIDMGMTAISMAVIPMTMVLCPMSMGLNPMTAERCWEASGIGAIMG